MPTLNKVLVPIDFSEVSREALRYACELAWIDIPQVTILHVVEDLPYAFPAGLVPPQLVESMLPERIERPLADARSEAEQLGITSAKTLVIQGVPYQEIVRTAAEGEYDMVIMGTHGYSGLKHALIGSVAEKVVRMAPCPVLTVRHLPHRFEHP